MRSEIREYLEKMPKRKKLLALAVILSGVLFPLAFTIWAFSTYNAFDNILDYAPLYTLFSLFTVAGLAVLVAASADLVSKVRRKDRNVDFPSLPTKLVALASILATIGFAAYVTVPQLVRSGDIPPQVILTESTPGTDMPGLVIAFYTEKPTVNTLEWGMPGGAHQTMAEEKPTSRHWFQLSGLEPGKSYEYSINGKTAGEFKTPAVSEPLRFAMSGDSHFGAASSRNDLTQTMLKKIEDPANNYSMLFFVGDSVQNGFSDALWKKAFSSFSSVSSSIPTEYVMGNHDAMFGGEGLYKTYLCPPGMTDPQRQCLTKRIDVGRAHFLVLDVEWELQTYTKDQKQWLVQQLSEIPKDDWCIVVSHTFYYSSGSFRDGWAWYDNQATIRELTPLFEDYGVDLVLSGHKHDAEVLQKNGVTYVVLGAFGGPPDPERTYVSPASLWYKQGVYAFADVTIENSTTAEIRIMDSEYAELYRTTIRQKH